MIIHLVMLAPLIEKGESMYIKEGVSWIDPIKSYLRDRTLLEDKKEVDSIRKRSSLFYLENGWLYKCSFSMPLLMYWNKEEVKYALRELHEGICGSHVAGSSLILKTLRNGYF